MLGSIFSGQVSRFRRIAFALLLIVLVAGTFAFRAAGTFLTRQDPIAHADAIFVFAGTRIERPLEAVDLLREGYAPLIVLSRAMDESAASHIEKKGVRVPSDFELTRELLRNLGVPDSAVLATERLHDNTGEEARTLSELTQRHGWRRIIVVSSGYHLRRVALACRRALGDDVALIVRGSRYDTATPDRWWSSRRDIRFVTAELPKLLAYSVGVN